MPYTLFLGQRCGFPQLWSGASDEMSSLQLRPSSLRQESVKLFQSAMAEYGKAAAEGS